MTIAITGLGKMIVKSNAVARARDSSCPGNYYHSG
jgi:hypothetical protein